MRSWLFRDVERSDKFLDELDPDYHRTISIVSLLQQGLILPKISRQLVYNV